MNRTTTVGAAAVLAMAGWLFYRAHVSRKTAEITALYGRGTTVWVAARDMLAGHEIGARDLELAHVPAAFVQPGAYTNVDWTGAGIMVQVPVRKGEQVLATKLALDGAGILSLRIGLGGEARAITLKLDAEGGLAGLLHPRDRVDVLGVFESAGSSAEMTRSHAAVLAHAVRVLAVDQRLGEGAEPWLEAGPAAARIAGAVPRQVYVTVEVTAAEAWRLSLASQMAYLRCVLRNRGNDRVEPLAPPSDRLPSLKGDEVFGARVPVKIRTAAPRSGADLNPF